MSAASLDPATPAPPGRRRALIVATAALAAGTAALLLGVAVVLLDRGREPNEALPVLGALPSFTLTNERGEPFGSADLRGKIWVANFIFTRCPTVCPIFTRKMASLQPAARELGPAIHLVSFSVDPEYDRPDVLRAYASKAGAEAGRWTFLTGEAEAIRATVVEGFRVSLGRQGAPGDPAAIFHGTHFVLVDGEGRIRGYYASDDVDAVERLRGDMTSLGRGAFAR